MQTEKSEFFDRLYKGFEAEYLVMGRIYAAGLEAFKLPGDFGMTWWFLTKKLAR